MRETRRETLVDRLRRYLSQSEMSHTERFDRSAERFYRETGFMAPGKSVPMEMAGGWDDDERGAAWDAWNTRERATWQQDMRDVIALLEAGP